MLGLASESCKGEAAFGRPRKQVMEGGRREDLRGKVGALDILSTYFVTDVGWNRLLDLRR